jgi:DnaB-like helicase C terminal domain
MALFENAFITRLCDGGDYRSIKDKVTSDYLTQVATKTAWNFIQRHAADHGVAPSRSILRDQFPSFVFEPSSDSVTALAERLHQAYVYRTIALNTDEVMQLAATDPVAAASLQVEHGSAMRTILNRVDGNIDVDITKQMGEEREAYYFRAEAKGLIGMAWPWEILNRRTLGIEAGSLYAFYARPKTGKTFYLIALLEHCHYRYQCRTILFGREMRAEQLRSRYTATVAKIDYDRYQHGKLTREEMERWEEALEVIAELPTFIISTVSSNGAEAADEMFQKAEDMGADVIGVDGAYFFGDREWDTMAQFTSRLKYNLLYRRRMPCFITTQAAKAARAGGDDVGYSDGLLQDADMLVKLKNDPEDMSRVHMATAGIRDGRPASWQVWRRPCEDFGQAFVEPDEVYGGGSGSPAEVQV